MSLWTPDGERPIQRATPAAAPDPVGDELFGADVSGMIPPSMAEELAALPPEERAEAERVLAEMMEVQRRVLEAPAADVIANHLMGIYELAAMHLNQEVPNFAEASVAIDSLRAVVSAVEGRLGENEPVLQQAVQQLQMAFVQIKSEIDAAT